LSGAPLRPANEAWLPRFVADAEKMIVLYSECLDEASTEQGREAVVASRDSVWPWACECLNAARQWNRWATYRGEADASCVGYARRVSAEGAWLWASADTPDALAQRPLPSRETLKFILSQCDALTWLIEQGAELPDWFRVGPPTAQA